MMVVKKINIGVIGCGYWGPNHIRIFSYLQQSNVTMACDIDNHKLNRIRGIFPHITLTTNYLDIINNSDIDAVIISTPTITHYEIAKKCLESGKHVLCEKPLSVLYAESTELVSLAKKVEKILLLGQIFLFHKGIQELYRLIHDGVLGKLYYCRAVRTNLGPIRKDVNVVYDLASHDISIFNYLLNSQPIEVSATGKSYLSKNIQDVANISMNYENDISVNIHVSWLAPKKVREITLVGEKNMVLWNDLSDIGQVLIYNSKVISDQNYGSFGEFQLLAKESDIIIPKITMEEPLNIQGQYFLNSIINDSRSIISDGESGANVVRVIDGINKSIESSGKPIVV